MANELAARSLSLKIGPEGDSTVAVPNLSDFSMSHSATEIDITAYGNSGHRDYFQGMRDITMDFTIMYPATNAGSALPVRDILHSLEELKGDDSTASTGGKLQFEVLIDGTNTYLAGKCLITSISHEMAMDDVYRISVSARVCGEPTTYDWLHS